MAPPSRARRIDVKFDAVLTTVQGHSFRVMVLDVSAGGFRVELDDHLIVGERILLKVGSRQSPEAEIRWTVGHEAGARFLSGISVAA